MSGGKDKRKVPAKRAASKQAPLPKPSKAIPVEVTRDATPADQYRAAAGVITSPEVATNRVVAAAERATGMGDLMDVPAMLAELRAQAAKVQGGDLSAQEAMLANQATALQSIFARLAERAMGCDSVVPFEANMRMALRAQSQCRATIETLAMIKNPPIVYARQANIANGPQQVNNGLALARGIDSTDSTPNKLLGVRHELLPDASASNVGSGANQEMEAVGAINGAAHALGKGNRRAERLQREDTPGAPVNREGA